MSDGPSDAAALGRMSYRLWDAVCELRDELVKVQRGHRGMTVDVEEIANREFKKVGYRLVKL